MSKRARPPVDERAAPADAKARALLQVWLSPAFPVGAFAYSHGLEKAVELGWVRGRETLEHWLADLLALGTLPNDLVLLAASWRAGRTSNLTELRDIADLGAALQPSAERHLEATQQGRSFVDQIDAAWPVGSLRASEAFAGTTPTLSVAVGYAAAAHAIPLADTLAAYAVAWVGNLTSAAIRLSIVGQTDAQRVTAALFPRLLAAAHRAESATLAELGAATFRADIASMLHETQHVRLFRS
jgi:urease accessory protein